MIKAIFSLLLVLALSVKGQTLEQNYKPLNNYLPTALDMERLTRGFDVIYGSIDFEKKGEGKNFKKVIESTKKQLFMLNEDSLLMKNDVITKYLQSVVDHIKATNPLLAGRDYTVLIQRKSQANAFNCGNGIILFNLNLVARLKNEGNIAFILCHEISHDLKGHVIDGIINNYKIGNDPKLKKQYDAIKAQEFNTMKSYENYLAEYLQKITSRSRTKEMQADSLGLNLYINTGFNINQAYETMSLLDSIDVSAFRDTIDHKKYFGATGKSFSASWLEEEAGEETIGGGNILDAKFPDSLKTHPDCSYRLDMMKKLNLSGKSISTPIANFQDIHTMAQFEMLRVYLEEFDIGRGFYECLQLYTKHPNNNYLKASIVEYLYLIYVLKRKHYFAWAVDKPNPTFIKSYNQTLLLLNNMPSEPCRNLAGEFFKSNFTDGLITDPYVAFTLLLLKSIDKTQEERKAMVDQYRLEFGKNSYYLTLQKRIIK